MNAAVEATPASDGSEGKLSGAWIGLMVATIVLVLGWIVPLRDYITPRSGLGYALGIVGGSLMLALLIYPARKRIASLAFIGSPVFWFRFHMILGVAGPLCILYHCGYKTGATNSNVALWSMIIVAGSGLIGRYLYSRIHFGLYGSKATLDDFRSQATNLKVDGSGAGRLLPGFGPKLDAAEKRIGIDVPLIPKASTSWIMWWLGRVQMRAFIKVTLREAANSSLAISEHRATLHAAACRYAEARLGAARRVAEFQSCQKLFSLWHILHLPLFGMLFVAGIVHVIAVNIY
jgi:hypothetical protein